MKQALTREFALGDLLSGSRLLGTALVVGIAVLTASVSSNLVTAQAGANPNPSRIAIINIEEVLNGLEYLRIEQGKLKAKADERQAELTALANEIDDMQKKLDMVSLEDSKRRDQAAALVEKGALAQAKTNAYQQIINIEKGDLFKKAHEDVSVACKDFAEKNGYDIVIVDDRSIRFEPNMSSDMVSAIIAQKRVMHASDAIDITKPILTKMNNEFAAGGRPAPPKKR